MSCRETREKRIKCTNKSGHRDIIIKSFFNVTLYGYNFAFNDSPLDHFLRVLCDT
jgi:hypothetical protein